MQSSPKKFRCCTSSRPRQSKKQKRSLTSCAKRCASAYRTDRSLLANSVPRLYAWTNLDHRTVFLNRRKQNLSENHIAPSSEAAPSEAWLDLRRLRVYAC